MTKTKCPSSYTWRNSQREKAARRTHAWLLFLLLLLCSLGVNPDPVVQPHKEEGGIVRCGKENKKPKGETRRAADAGHKATNAGNERMNARESKARTGRGEVEEMKSKSKSKLEGAGASGDRVGAWAVRCRRGFISRAHYKKTPQLANAMIRE